MFHLQKSGQSPRAVRLFRRRTWVLRRAPVTCCIDYCAGISTSVHFALSECKWHQFILLFGLLDFILWLCVKSPAARTICLRLVFVCAVWLKVLDVILWCDCEFQVASALAAALSGWQVDKWIKVTWSCQSSLSGCMEQQPDDMSEYNVARSICLQYVCVWVNASIFDIYG